MDSKEYVLKKTWYIALIMILVGVVLLLLSKILPIPPETLLNTDSTFLKIVESIGILCISVFTISLVYEKCLAEKHFEQFRKETKSMLMKMDSIQNKCLKLGILEIFETRNTLEQKYPLIELFKEVKNGGTIIIVCKTLFHLSNKLDALKAALQKGAEVKLACLSPNTIPNNLAKVSFLDSSHEAKVPLGLINNNLVSWMKEKKPSGTLEIGIYDNPLPDSFMYIEHEDRDIILWDLSFGRDLNDKKVFLIDKNNGHFGANLFKRYQIIYSLSKKKLNITKNGIEKYNNLPKVIKEYKEKEEENE